MLLKKMGLNLPLKFFFFLRGLLLLSARSSIAGSLQEMRGFFVLSKQLHRSATCSSYRISGSIWRQTAATWIVSCIVCVLIHNPLLHGCSYKPFFFLSFSSDLRFAPRCFSLL